MNRPDPLRRAALSETGPLRKRTDKPKGAGSRTRGLSGLAGMVAPVLFVAVFTVEGWLRRGYDPASMFVSELSLGPRGWVQITNFLITGGLLLVFAHGVAAHSAGSRVAPALLAIIGGSLVASGLFVTDPSAMFNQVSRHGVIHGLFGAVVFSLAPVLCFVSFGGSRHDPGWRSFAHWTFLVGTVLVVGILVLKASQDPQSGLYAWKGLIQRVFLFTFMAWLFTFASRLDRSSDHLP